MSGNCNNCNPVCFKEEVRNGLGNKHTLFIHSLGICSAIALTGYIHTTLVISLIILLVATVSAFLISLLRNILLHRGRFVIQVAIISSLVILLHLVLQVFWPDMRNALGPYLGLVITNCLIMDSCEQHGLTYKPFETVKKTFGRTIGYVALLLLVSLIREPLGNGSFAGTDLFPGTGKPLLLVGAAPGAFFVLGFIWWIHKAAGLRARQKTMSSISHPELVSGSNNKPVTDPETSSG